MLIRLTIENFMSFKDQQVFSLMAGKHTKHSNHVIRLNGKRVLKGSFFFGANAAGKSNLYEAINFSRYTVLHGVKQNKLVNKHFRIDSKYLNKPGVFQFDIYSNGHFYSYGFAISYTKAIVIEEWLYICDLDEVKIFERVIEDGVTKVSSEYNFGDKDQSQLFKVFAENVPDHKLLLTEISERKLSEQDNFSAFKNVSQWFKDLVLISPNSMFRDKLRLFSDEQEYDFASIINEFDTGIESISLGKDSVENVLDFLPSDLKTDIMNEVESSFNKEDETVSEVNINIMGRSLRFVRDNGKIVASKLMMNHGNEHDQFSLADESDGTQRLFDLIPVFRLAKKPCVIFIDELDRSFHTILVTNYLKRFYSISKGVPCQLIATVHDTNIMDLDLLRQDEIWFVERQEDHSSRIYSLNVFKARFDKKIVRDYLIGRYGAIPCITQMNRSIAEE